MNVSSIEMGGYKTSKPENSCGTQVVTHKEQNSLTNDAKLG